YGLAVINYSVLFKYDVMVDKLAGRIHQGARKSRPDEPRAQCRPPGAAGAARLGFLWTLPAAYRGLLRACDRQLVVRSRAGDYRARCDRRIAADRDRGDEGRVGADERAFADLRAVLVHAVGIAGDGARAHVGLAADFG